MKKHLLLTVLLAILLGACQTPQNEVGTDVAKEDNIQFAFLTDIHLTRDKEGDKGFMQAIQHVNGQDCDFVITGGDLIMDALGVSFGEADSLYQLYTLLADSFQMPVYNTLGNHEIFGIYEKSGVEATHPDYAKNMFRRYFKHDSYYAFMHKDWCFMVLDGVSITADRHHYTGYAGEEEMNWIRSVLDTLPTTSPIVISTHIPFITTGTQLQKGSTLPNDSAAVISNSKELRDLFKNHNLKLVLQGHLHFYENIEVGGIHYVTGGAVSGRWWTGPNEGTEEGYVRVKTNKQEIESIEYIDYGWEAKAKQE